MIDSYKKVVVGYCWASENGSANSVVLGKPGVLVLQKTSTHWGLLHWPMKLKNGTLIHRVNEG